MKESYSTVWRACHSEELNVSFHPRPDSGLGSQVKVLETFQGVPPSLGSGQGQSLVAWRPRTGHRGLSLSDFSLYHSLSYTHTFSFSLTHPRSLPQALDALTRLVQAWPREKGSKGSGNGSKSDNGSRVLGKGSKGKGASGTRGSVSNVLEGASKGAEVYRLTLSTLNIRH